MTETELKISLDAGQMARLRRHPALTALREVPRRTEKLLSIYCDTGDHRLARAGMTLRLRRIGRSWVQTVKAGGQPAPTGFFAHQEVECPAPGGRLVLNDADPTGVYAAVRKAVGDAPLAPVFETRVERVTERLHLAGLGVIELALDKGWVVAGEAKAPILEAELELVGGDVRAVFALASRLFSTGPVRFATANNAALGYRLVRGEGAPPEAVVRGAGSVAIEAEATVERVARDVFRDCFAQIAQNAAVVAVSDAPEGPHQLRVGLRRLRTALAVFGPSLGREAVKGMSDAAREMGRVVGRLRDVDVLTSEVVAEAAAFGLDGPARTALVGALETRRVAVRGEVRTWLAGEAATQFLFDLLEFIEARGWLAPADYEQTGRLAVPIGGLAPRLLEHRRARVAKVGRRIETLDVEALHALRKELKKLRYTVDMFAPLYGGKGPAAFLGALKEMQDTFGSLNDAAMAAEALHGPEAPARGDADAQRAVGWVLGTLAVRVTDDRPRLYRRWTRLMATPAFWE